MNKRSVDYLIEKRLIEIKFDNSFSKNLKLIKSINSYLGCKINSLQLDVDMTKYSSYIDFLLEMDDDGLSQQNKDLADIKVKIIAKIRELTLFFKNNSSDLPSYLGNLKSFASIRRDSFGREIFSEIYIDDEINPDMVNRLIDYFNEAIVLINPRLLDKIKDVNLLIKWNQDGEEQYFSNLEKNVISLTINEDTNIFLLLAVLVHEVIHLVEFHNQEVNNLAHEFIKQRAISVNKAENRRGRPSANWKDVLAYDLKMDDPHSGFVYENKLTEVLTTGVQNFILAPILMIFKDVEYIEVLNKFFKIKESKNIS